MLNLKKMIIVIMKKRLWNITGIIVIHIWKNIMVYQDYIACKDYLAITDRKEVELSYSNDAGERTKTAFDVAEQVEKYKQKVEDNAQNCKYERNRKYLTQFAENVVSD